MSQANWIGGRQRASGRRSGRLRKSIRLDLMGMRHPNPRLVKIHRNYSVEDIARLFSVHKNTVRSWLKQGLATIDDRQPMLILGRELLRFVQERRRKAKQTCGPGRIFCIACRAPKMPAGKMADCTATGPLAGRRSSPGWMVWGNEIVAEAAE